MRSLAATSAVVLGLVLGVGTYAAQAGDLSKKRLDNLGMEEASVSGVETGAASGTAVLSDAELEEIAGGAIGVSFGAQTFRDTLAGQLVAAQPQIFTYNAGALSGTTTRSPAFPAGTNRVAVAGGTPGTCPNTLGLACGTVAARTFGAFNRTR